MTPSSSVSGQEDGAGTYTQHCDSGARMEGSSWEWRPNLRVSRERRVLVLPTSFPTSFPTNLHLPPASPSGIVQM